MKKFTLLLGALVMVASSAVALSGCAGAGEVVGSGKPITQEYDVSQLNLPEFIIVAAENGMQVSITQSENWSLSLTADDNIFKYVVIDTEGYTLKIGLDETLTYRNVTMKAVIAMPSIVGLSLNEGSVGTISGFNALEPLENFSLKLIGGSQVTGNITTGDCQFDLSGGSTVQLFGSGGDTRITASDASHLNLANFQIDNAKVYLNKGSEATITARGELSGELLGGSQLFYYGNPTLGPVESSGGSSIKKIG